MFFCGWCPTDVFLSIVSNGCFPQDGVLLVFSFGWCPNHGFLMMVSGECFPKDGVRLMFSQDGVQLMLSVGSAPV